ncbi:hypothetical protein DSM106972_096550 [Dulcicalothrix desertica PCC 7102]|uniref:Uncharacterized protein n=1 Tax=Dulcicalothrix desertica PCC 7102 TaxID=232991 RepID=A0A3S5K2R8_9CYAN|nr:hypothetical protein [Dulcicalothrix desertica]RUS93299.1 hypothetical protein DSM106972_096550 [Dulcicalothrix desertica PCC 7102]TWH62758.1 hypothetical protein CAL7102_00281 [Dulcicalothrix desertica PCC 7102]
MLRTKNIVQVIALSTVMFGAGVSVATVALSYLPMVNASSTSIAQGIKQSKEEVDEDNDLKFRVQGCKRVGKNVACDVLATNLKKENRKLWISWSTQTRGRVIDTNGNQYIAKQTQIGQSISKDGEPLAANLIEGVPTKIIYTFEIPREVTNLAVVEVNYNIPAANASANSIDGKVAIRDINIGAAQASNPTKNDCIPAQTNPKKPRQR